MAKIFTHRWGVVLKYVGLSAIILPLSFASALGIRPFGAAFVMALILLGLPYLFCMPMFALAEMLADHSVANIIFVLVIAVVSFCGRLLTIKFKKQSTIITLCSAIAAQSGLFAMVSFGNINIVQAIVWASLGVSLTFLFLSCVNPVIIKKLKFKLLQTEVIAVCILLCCYALGLAQISIFNVELLPIVAVPIILVSGYVGKTSGAMVSAMCFGLALAINTFSVVPIAIYVFMAVVASMFISAPRVLSSMSAIMAYTMIVYFFAETENNIMYTFISLAIGAVIYSLIPKFILEQANAFISASHASAAARGMINRARKNMGSSLIASSRIFDEMSAALTNKKREQVDGAFILQNKICSFCENYNSCKSLDGYNEALEKVMEVSTAKGRASVREMPVFLSAKCINLSRLVMFAGSEAEKNHERLIKCNCESAARQIVCEQLGGMAKVLLQLGTNASCEEQFDVKTERALIEELNYSGVVASEALVTNKNISILVRTETLDRSVILRAVKRIVKSEFMFMSADSDYVAGYTAINLEICPKFDVAFALSATPKIKGEKSGDSHSFIKIGSDKFMMALCDGMGSGSEAAKASEAAISLVESFYKAGFEHDLVLESVNKFLTLGGGERYSTLDICIVDLNSGMTDIIKFGSPATIIKSKDTARCIDGSSLPIGALDGATPSIYTANVCSGEMLIMTSDGVSESFEDIDLLNSVNNLHTNNPSIVANGLLEHTISKCNGIVKDDSTVLCAKLFARV